MGKLEQSNEDAGKKLDTIEADLKAIRRTLTVIAVGSILVVIAVLLLLGLFLFMLGYGA